MGLVEQLGRALAPLRARIMGMIARGVVKLVDDTKGRQELQLSLLAQEVASGVEHMQSYGHTAVPPAGSEAVVLFLGGSREHPIAVAVEDRTVRPRNLEQGEVMLYTDELDFLHFKRGRNVQLVTEALSKQVDSEETDAGTLIEFRVGTSSLKIEAGKITITADDIQLNEP